MPIFVVHSSLLRRLKDCGGKPTSTYSDCPAIQLRGGRVLFFQRSYSARPINQKLAHIGYHRFALRLSSTQSRQSPCRDPEESTTEPPLAHHVKRQGRTEIRAGYPGYGNTESSRRKTNHGLHCFSTYIHDTRRTTAQPAPGMKQPKGGNESYHICC